MKKVAARLIGFIFIFFSVVSAHSSDAENLKTFELMTFGNDLMTLDAAFKAYQKDYDHIEYSKKNKWRRAVLLANEEKINVKYKLLSKTPIASHAGSGYYSLNIEVLDKNNIYGQTKFNLVSDKRFGITINSGGKIFEEIGYDLGVISQRQVPVGLSIDGGPARKYLFESKINANKYMEWLGLPEYMIFGDGESKGFVPSKSFVYDSNYYAEYKDEDLYRERLTKSVQRNWADDFKASNNIIENYANFNSDLINKKFANIEKWFDIEYIGKYEAIRAALGNDGHGLSADNLVVYYNSTNAKFYPAITRDDQISSLERGRSIERGTDTHKYINKYITLFETISRNNYLRSSKYEKLGDLYTLFQKYSASDLEYDSYGYKLRNHIAKNLDVIKEVLTKSEIAVDRLNSDEFHIKLSADSYGANLIADVIGINWNAENTIVNVKEISDGIVVDQYDASLVYKNKLLRLINHRNGLDVVFTNTLGEDSKGYDREYILKNKNFEFADSIAFVNLFDKSKNSYKIKEADNRSTFFDYFHNKRIFEKSDLLPSVIVDDVDMRITMPAGNYFVSSDTVFPIGYETIIEQGANIYLSNNASLIFNGSLYIKGTKKNPVTITSKSPNAHFGVVSVHGNFSDQVVKIHGLNLSHGSESYVGNIHHTGALSVFNVSNVIIESSNFDRCKGDDALNIKRAKFFNLNNLGFKDNFADSIDIDNSVGSVNNVYIHNRLKDSLKNSHNGDGLDLSGSVVSVRNLYISGMGDKGISVGEMSTVHIENTNIKDSNIGIASKDSSFVLMGNFLKLTNNSVDLSAYRKKPFFSGGVFVFSNQNQYATLSYKLDDLSRTLVDDRIISRFPLNNDSVDMVCFSNFRNNVLNGQYSRLPLYDNMFPLYGSLFYKKNCQMYPYSD